MPFYEYQCKSCGAHHEAMQKMADAPLKKCPACGKSQLQRLISAPVFRLKGGGWYETDFKSDSEAKRNLADREDKGEKSDAEAKPEAKPEAKADATAEAKPEAKATAKPETAKASTDAKPAVTASKSAAKPVARSAAKPAAKRPAPKAAKRR